MTETEDWQERSRPTILLVADSVDGERSASRVIEAAGASIVAALRIEASVDAFESHSSAAAIWIELSRDHGANALPALAVARQAALEGTAVTVAIPPELIDAVDATLGDTPATLLVLPDDAERTAALCIALNSPALAGVEDIKAERDLERLRRLSEELNRVARSLSRTMPSLTGYAAPRSEFAAEPGDSGAPPPFPPVEEVRKIIRIRRLRDSFIDSGLLADPAWDMLLDLFAARIDDDDVAVSSLCIAAAVPATTALRWIKTLTENGTFERHADPQDARRVFITLSDGGTRAMAGYFQALRRLEGVSI